LGTPWFRFYADGVALNLMDGEVFSWSENGSLDAILYESWEVNGNTLTVTWTTGATFNYSRIAGTQEAAAAEQTSDSEALIGDWTFLGTPWFRFNADGTAENLSDGERFNWNEDGSISNAILYRSWSVRGDTLIITWTTGAEFSYTRD